MTRHATARIKPYLAATLLALSAPAAIASVDHEGGHGNNEAGGHVDGHGHATADFAFGRAAPPANADRTIDIIARDDMSFDPETVNVQPGETVRFRVRNVGDLQHSFTLGTREYHRRHDRQMQRMPADEIAHHMQDSSNGMVIQPGKTGTLTWRFERGGSIRFACHIPGHYPAGMWGEIDTSSEPLSAMDPELNEE